MMKMTHLTNMETLKMVQIVFRHGLRTPFSNVYPGDPNQEFLSIGFGQLTKEGRIQMYQLGKALGTRYESLINNNPRNIYSRSSGKDRCLDSLSSFLASFCPPKGYYKWNEELNWQPIPINSMPREMDKELHGTDNNGVTFRFARPKLNDELKKSVKNLEEATGVMFEDSNPFFRQLDGVVAEVEHGLPLLPQVDCHVKDIYNILDEYFVEMIARPQDTVSNGGGLFELTSTNIRNAINKSDSSTKAFLYCTSDFNLIGLMTILGVYKGKRMNFGSTFIIELHEIDEKPYVYMLYNDDVTKNPSNFEILNLPNEEIYSPISAFEDIGNTYIKNIPEK